MSVKIKSTLHKVTIDSTHLRLVQLTNDVYKIKSNDLRYEWEENNKERAIQRFIEDSQGELALSIRNKNRG